MIAMVIWAPLVLASVRRCGVQCWMVRIYTNSRKCWLWNSSLTHVVRFASILTKSGHSITTRFDHHSTNVWSPSVRKELDTIYKSSYSIYWNYTHGCPIPVYDTFLCYWNLREQTNIIVFIFIYFHIYFFLYIDSEYLCYFTGSNYDIFSVSTIYTDPLLL